MMTSCSAALPVPPRFSLTKTPMPEQSIEQRLTNFDEVELGYTPEQAMQEAERCLNCPDRYCAAHCPAHNYIPEFIAEIRAGRFDRAWELLAFCPSAVGSTTLPSCLSCSLSLSRPGST